MRIQALHTNFILPKKGSDQAGAFDIYMPEPGVATLEPKMFGLGFASEVPEGHVALLLPRSSTGSKFGLELNNTCGVIDSDYRGEWKAMLRTKFIQAYSWAAGDRILQFLVVPVAMVTLELVESVDKTEDKAVQREIARRIVDEDLTRDAAEVVREASGKAPRTGGSKSKGRGAAAPARGSVRMFKVAGAKIDGTFLRKSVKDEEVLEALEEAIEQVRASLAG